MVIYWDLLVIYWDLSWDLLGFLWDWMGTLWEYYGNIWPPELHVSENGGFESPFFNGHFRSDISRPLSGDGSPIGWSNTNLLRRKMVQEAIYWSWLKWYTNCIPMYTQYTSYQPHISDEDGLKLHHWSEQRLRGLGWATPSTTWGGSGEVIENCGTVTQ
jgi:hypothetical protein